MLLLSTTGNQALNRNGLHDCYFSDARPKKRGTAENFPIQVPTSIRMGVKMEVPAMGASQISMRSFFFMYSMFLRPRLWPAIGRYFSLQTKAFP